MPSKNYQPPQEILDKYADVLVNFALDGGKGIKAGDVVEVTASECSKPLYFAVRRKVTAAGGHFIGVYTPDDDHQFNFSKDFYEHATAEQLKFYSEPYYAGLAETVDHRISIIGDADPHSLKGVDTQKMMLRGVALKPFSDLLRAKESAGKFSWTLGLYGTEGSSKEAGMSLEEYWEQIINACYLAESDPVAKWRKTFDEINAYRDKLNALPISKLHIGGEDVDLYVKIGEQRKWDGGDGANIPSFEIFTSPDWRGTEGWIRFNQPLYRYGTMITGIELHFEKGRVVKASAKENEEALLAMISTPNADKIGEFSLTDSRHSRITKFMAETLYDENVGGRYGNTHIAVGQSYHCCYTGDETENSEADWKSLGFNDSSVHTDIVSTTNRVVTAHMTDGSEKVIYSDGQFQI